MNYLTRSMAAAIFHAISRAICVGVVLHVSVGRAALPATEAATQPAADVSSLIRQLSNDDYATRQAAQTALVDRGEEILPHLRAALATQLSDEARARVEAAIQTIASRKMPEPAVITLHYHDAPMQAVLNDFAKQVGAPMGTGRQKMIDFALGKRVSIDLEKAGFWESLRAITKATGLYANPLGDNSTLILDIGPPLVQFPIFSDQAKISGPFMIVPQFIERHRMVGYSGEEGDASKLTIQLCLLVEPPLRILGPIDDDWLKHCIDEKGNDLASAGSWQEYGPCWWVPMRKDLTEVPGMGEKIADLQLQFHLLLQTRTQELEVADVAHAGVVNLSAGDSSLMIKGMESQASNQSQVQVSLTGPITTMTSLAQLSAFPAMQLLDEDNHPLQYVGHSSGSKGFLDFSLIYNDNDPNRAERQKRPKKFRWLYPSEVKQVPVEFDLHNLRFP